MSVWMKADQMVSITEANQNFSKVARLVDEKKFIVVLKNNKPAYVILDFEAYENELADGRRFETALDKVLAEDEAVIKRLAE